MKGARFFLEFPSPMGKKFSGKTLIGHKGNVTCVLWRTCRDIVRADGSPDKRYDGVGAYYAERNSPCGPLEISEQFLKAYCKRISEQVARNIHPKLFAYID